MSAQLTYTKNLQKAAEGSVAWDNGPADATSFAVEAAVPFGKAVVRGTNKKAVIVGDTDVIGFSIRSLVGQDAVNNGTTEYAIGEAAGVLRSGYIWVKNIGAAVAAGDAAAVAANGDLDAGGTAVPNCVIEEAAATGELALIKVAIVK